MTNQKVGLDTGFDFEANYIKVLQGPIFMRGASASRSPRTNRNTLFKLVGTGCERSLVRALMQLRLMRVVFGLLGICDLPN
jgi:hypothetical protein